jgi:hypothetical protein
MRRKVAFRDGYTEPGKGAGTRDKGWLMSEVVLILAVGTAVLAILFGAPCGHAHGRGRRNAAIRC